MTIQPAQGGRNERDYLQTSSCQIIITVHIESLWVKVSEIVNKMSVYKNRCIFICHPQAWNEILRETIYNSIQPSNT
jgi:hypothetical protein